SHYPDRHIGLACLPYGDIDAAVAEVHRVAKLGFKGIELSCSWDMEPMWHPCWEPLWEAINEVGIPLHFHTFPSVSPKLREQYTGLTLRALSYSSLCLFQMTLGNILTALMGRAVFERYPNMRIAFGESGIGWIPYVIDRMDFEYEDQYKDLPLKLKPSEYWRRQCKATFQYDRVGTKLIDEMGVETLMWGSDYPHPDGVLRVFLDDHPSIRALYQSTRAIDSASSMPIAMLNTLSRRLLPRTCWTVAPNASHKTQLGRAARQQSAPRKADCTTGLPASALRNVLAALTRTCHDFGLTHWKTADPKQPTGFSSGRDSTRLEVAIFHDSHRRK